MRTRCIQHNSLFIAAIALFIAADGLQAHKPVTSKFTYYENIQPLFRFYCGGCHVSKGIAPMSLLTYKEAYPWAESIKEQLLADSMNPWNDDETVQGCIGIWLFASFFGADFTFFRAGSFPRILRV